MQGAHNVKRVLLIAAARGDRCRGLINAQRQPFVPVSEEMLLKPSPDDWLMYSRTYDAQRFSPLNQINTKNVGQLREVFKKELPAGVQESIPIVYRGVMYVLLPGNGVRALDATTGAMIWERNRPSGAARAKTIAIYEDMIFNSTADGFIEALDARTGELRWETKSSGRLTAGVVVIEGKVISGRACAPRREDCYVAAHDAKTGKEVWRFYTAAASNEPGGDTWAGAPDETRAASTWALPGGYDPQRRLIYWGVANPTPNTRANRHGGNSNAVGDRVAGGSVQQLDDRARSRYRQAEVVLPAPSRRRLGRGLRQRAHAAADDAQPRSEVREVDQSGHQARRAARRHGDDRRGRRSVRQRPRHRSVPLGTIRSRSTRPTS